MSAHPQTPVISFPAHRKSAVHGESATQFVVRDSAAFKVAPSRLFYALTLPEYIETWLTPPDADEVRCAGNPTGGEALSIQLRCNGRAANSILADYKRISMRELHIRWYIQSPAHVHASHLRISIRTVRADAHLRIRHSGFVNPSEWGWHQELWGLSLVKMQMLIL
jgi:uncharacterized protein YndB with AHSA1/START domain